MNKLLIERPAEHVALLRINRPEVRNALSFALRERLAAELARLDGDEGTRCIIIAGSEKSFAAGGDLKEQEGLGPVGMMLRGGGRAWDAIAACRKPVIAAVRGYAFGGGFELVLTTDMVIAGEGAVFALPEVRFGQLPGGGGTQRLARIVGKNLALELLLTGRSISSREAARLGIVNRVTPDNEVDATAVALASEIAAMAPLAVEQIKEVVLNGLDAPLHTALLLERRAGQVLYDSEDKHDGLRAFREKRSPKFKGR